MDSSKRYPDPVGARDRLKRPAPAQREEAPATARPITSAEYVRRYGDQPLAEAA